ncbi:HNH endonuclease [Halobacillus hunanensis]|uniref:HNH endonuclease n=1 Tax=Halobacillus hunanensis TaxID=578214 RepID=UPI0009A60429
MECHHSIPSQSLRQGIKKLKDLVLVCSNCHRMLHRKTPWLTKKQLKSLIK